VAHAARLTGLPRVDVVIPNWNGRELLATVLGTLDGQTFTDFRVLVADNGSSDGSVEWLRTKRPDVGVIALAENLGFAAAVNAGVAAGASEFVALLNNDMELEPRWLEELVGALDADPRAGAATPKQRSGHERAKLDGAGDVIAWTGGASRRGIGELDQGQYDTPGPVFSASAGAALYRRQALDDVGPFEESFFAYLEDVDWGLRARLRGWSALYVPSSVVYHLGGATSRRTPGRERYLIARNQVAMLLRTFPGRWIARFAPLIAAELARMLLAGQPLPVLRGWRDAVRRLPRTLRQRRAIQARRKVSLGELEEGVFGARRGRGDLLSTRPAAPRWT
jgi:GT2 family glycosyltransferase